MSERVELDGARIVLIRGDCLEELPKMAAKSVQCVVTSPPYFALRSYLPADHPLKSLEIGSEPTPEAFIETMVAVFREVRRVLRDDGVVFLNLGDGYGSGETGRHDYTQGRKCGTGTAKVHAVCQNTKPTGHGQLLNLPHRVAEALRADGWIWRQTIVWHKRSPMPESVNGWRWQRHRVKVKAQPKRHRNQTAIQYDRDHSGGVMNAPRAEWADCPGCEKCEPHGRYVLRRGSGRCTTAHEYIFVLAKTNRYFWDGEASKEPSNTTSGGACFGKIDSDGPGARRLSDEENAHVRSGARNPRSVWALSSEPTKVRHFATFPSEFVRKCLSAGISAGGCCPICEAPFAPVVERVSTGKSKAAGKSGEKRSQGLATAFSGYNDGSSCPEFRIHGYRPTCGCGRTDSIGCMVMDPFSGIGTVAQTARELGARAIGIDLNPEYHAEAITRVPQKPRWWLREHNAKPAQESTVHKEKFF